MFGPIAITYNIKAGLPLDCQIFQLAFFHRVNDHQASITTCRQLTDLALSLRVRRTFKYLDGASSGAWGKGASETFNGGVGVGAPAGTTARRPTANDRRVDLQAGDALRWVLGNWLLADHRRRVDQ